MSNPETTETIIDSPTGWVNAHINEYVETGGEKGHMWRGVPTLLLTTRGRKTGQLRRSALIYGRDGDNFVVVASTGGKPVHPAWYFNLDANPEVTVQVEAETFPARARTATAAEKPKLWAMMADLFPNYTLYQSKTEREIPVVILEPTQ